MISVQDELLAALQVVPEGTQTVYNCQEFQLMHRVVALGRTELAGLEADRTIILFQYTTNANQGGISVQSEGGIRTSLGESEDRSSRDSSLELAESINSVSWELWGKGFGGGGEGSEGSCDGGVVADEATVEASEAQKCADFSDVAGQGPVMDGSYLLGVQVNARPVDKIAEEDC
jgi:hypothetical protein